MLDEPIRVRCLACDTRLALPPKATYVACAHCGSEYVIARRGSAVTLQPLAPDELERVQAVAAVEREGEMGCANLGLSMLAAVTVLLCVIGGVGLQVFNSRAICTGTAALALVLVVIGAVVMRRNLAQTDQQRTELLAVQAATDPPLQHGDTEARTTKEGIGDDPE